MKDIAHRFPENPILLPKNLKPSNNDLRIIGLFNPGVFTFDGKIWLIVRVAESVRKKQDMISFSTIAPTGENQMLEVSVNDPELIGDDPRKIVYKGLGYLTSLSHLRLFNSEDGISFYEPEGYDTIVGQGNLERFGIEDCRVTKLDDIYYLTYTAVSESGVGVGLRLTRDWKNFEHMGMIFPPHNKDCAIFEQKINGKYYALHRPASIDIGGKFIWLAESGDAVHWGKHQCIVKTRSDNWDSARVGAGAAPIKTVNGWLEIYHGADKENRYCLGAFLMDLEDPSRVIARTLDPIMVPSEKYELNGFFGHVVFTNGHIVRGDEVTVYYGAADETICGAKFSINEILSLLH